jgi:inward rectifier potassium channel
MADGASEPKREPAKKRLEAGAQAQQQSFSVEVLGRAFAPHKDLYHLILRAPWWAFFGGAALVFFSTNALFAAVYSLSPGCISHVSSYEDAFFFSVQTLGTIGYGGMAPETRFGHVVVSFEAFTGIIMTAMMTGLTFAKFARPTARVLFSRYAVIYPRDGVPHLMFRMANFRTNNVIEAQLKVNLLVMERTREGEVMRRSIEIPLMRPSTSLFVLSWTALHRIDESSPFFGEGALDKLRAQKAELFLSFTGLDETIAAMIHARYRYSPDDIVEGARFADILTTKEDGTRVLDYSTFHDVVRGLPSTKDG